MRDDIKNKRIAILAPVAWRTPPRAYGAWETVASNITEGLVARGWKDVTLFATKESITKAKLVGWMEKGYEEDKTQIPKVSECLHISKVMERADEFDLIHNNFDYLPLTYLPFIKTPPTETKICLILRRFTTASTFPILPLEPSRVTSLSLTGGYTPIKACI
jgi:hypothetical protein